MNFGDKQDVRLRSVLGFLFLNADERVKTFSFPAGGIQVLRLQTQQPFPIRPLSVTQQTESRPCNVVPGAQGTEWFGAGIELLSVSPAPCTMPRIQKELKEMSNK